MLAIRWPQALAWRMRRQLLDPVGGSSVTDVVHHLGALRAEPDSAAELAVRIRRARSRSGDVSRALTEGRIIKTFAFRGATHLMTPEDGAAYLALRAASRMWELPSWQSFYGLSPTDWPVLRDSRRLLVAHCKANYRRAAAAIVTRPIPEASGLPRWRPDVPL